MSRMSITQTAHRPVLASRQRIQPVRVSKSSEPHRCHEYVEQRCSTQTLISGWDNHGPLSQLLTDEGESLNRLYNLVSQTGFDILFHDERGNTIGSYGSLITADPRSEYLKLKGAERTLTASSRFGRRPVTDSAPLICEKSSSVNCRAAPIFDAEGDLLGFLSLAVRDGDVHGEPSILARSLTWVTARAIEERSFRKRYSRQWIVALSPRAIVGCGMLLAVDDQLRIAAINRHGQAMNGRRLKTGVSLWAFFEEDPALFRNQNMGDIAATLVTAETAEIWLTLITPPESEMLRHYSPEHKVLHSRPRLDSLGYFCQSACPPLRVGGLTPRSLQLVREYIDAHLSENIKLESLADITGLSRYYFARAFKRSIGTPPHCYLVQRRLERAQTLLANTDLPLAQVALESGFHDQSHFSHRFRLATGVTPKVFRWLKCETAV